MYAIETRGLTKLYRTQFGRKPLAALDSLNLSISRQEIFGFLGTNGAGKTTTIKILCGLLRQTRGAARVLGIDVRKRNARKKLGYLPESPYFYEYLTPKETLDFHGRLEGLHSAERTREWDRLSELLNLRGIADQRIRGFSKGMRQRLGFAVALVGDPEVMILDEPMSGLDPVGRRNIREVILLLRDRKKTVFFSSHVLGDVEQICDRVGILAAGKLAIQGRIEDLLSTDVDEVEIVARGLSQATSEALSRVAIATRISENGHHFRFSGMEQANAMAQKIQAGGGSLTGFHPIRKTLEDYFIVREETQEWFVRRDRVPAAGREETPS